MRFKLGAAGARATLWCIASLHCRAALCCAGPLEPLQIQAWLLKLIAADRSSGGAGPEDGEGAAEGEL